MISIGMSTSCAFPLPLDEAFHLARLSGFDGVEIMVTNDPATQDAATLLSLSRSHHMPILSIHAPVLLATQFVWGVRPAAKLARSVELAAAVGASAVVVHPPFRFQGAFARAFEGTVNDLGERYGLDVAVENMFTWTISGRRVRAYSPSPYPTDLDVRAMTLDFSHAALAGLDSMEMAREMGASLRHVHLADGLGGTLFDEHLVPGHGSQPVAEVLAFLAGANWDGSVVAEVHTHRARTTAERLAILGETVDFARAAIAVGRTTPVRLPDRATP
jgi:sugar phosphate isomerase/epimerase